MQGGREVNQNEQSDALRDKLANIRLMAEAFAGLAPEEVILSDVRKFNRTQPPEIPDVRIREIVHEAVGAKSPPAPGSLDEEVAKLRASGRFRSFREIAESPPPAPVWIVEGIFERGTTLEVFGLENVGKSLLAQDLLTRVSWTGATGSGDWIGRPLLIRGPVLYVVTEAQRGAERRLLKMTANSGSLSEYDLDLLRLEPSSPRNFELLDYASRGRVLVVVDVLSGIHSADENSNTEMNAVVQRLQDIAEKNDVGVLILHHANKGSRDAKFSNQNSRGAGAIGAKFDGGINVVSDPEDFEEASVLFKITKLRDGDGREKRATHVAAINPETLRIEYRGERQGFGAGRPASYNAASTLKPGTLYTPGEMRELLRKAGADKRLAWKTVERWREAGDVEGNEITGYQLPF